MDWLNNPDWHWLIGVGVLYYGLYKIEAAVQSQSDTTKHIVSTDISLLHSSVLSLAAQVTELVSEVAEIKQILRDWESDRQANDLQP